MNSTATLQSVINAKGSIDVNSFDRIRLSPGTYRVICKKTTANIWTGSPFSDPKTWTRHSLKELKALKYQYVSEWDFNQIVWPFVEKYDQDYFDV